MSYEQTILQLLPKQPASFATFVPGPNSDTLNHVMNLLNQNGPCDDTLYLLGDEGSGKTHVLQAAYEHLKNNKLRAIYLPLKKMVVWEVAVFRALEQYDMVLLDDIDALFGITHWEEAVFNLLNRLKDNQRSCIMAAHLPPKTQNIVLPDLASRLNAALLGVLKPLEDEDKMMLLERHASALGFAIPRPIQHYIMRHYPRSARALIEHLHALDHASLVSHRPTISIPFVKSVLDKATES
jgi:DnaA-homolog protein